MSTKEICPTCSKYNMIRCRTSYYLQDFQNSPKPPIPCHLYTQPPNHWNNHGTWVYNLNTLPTYPLDLILTYFIMFDNPFYLTYLGFHLYNDLYSTYFDWNLYLLVSLLNCCGLVSHSLYSPISSTSSQNHPPPSQINWDLSVTWGHTTVKGGYFYLTILTPRARDSLISHCYFKIVYSFLQNLKLL